MASENKVAKLKNSYCAYGMLKNKSSELKLKRVAFYTSSDRQELNREDAYKDIKLEDLV